MSSSLKTSLKTKLASFSSSLSSSMGAVILASVLNADATAQTNDNVVEYDRAHNSVEISRQADGGVSVAFDNQTQTYNNPATVLRFSDGIDYNIGSATFEGSDDPAIRDRIYGSAGDETIVSRRGNDLIYASTGADNIIGGEMGNWGDTLYFTQPECNEATTLDLVNFNNVGACAEGDVYMELKAYVMPANQNNTILADELSSNQVTGGNQTDIARYPGNYADYTVEKQSNGSVFVDYNGQDKQRYINFETVEFADGAYDVATNAFNANQVIITHSNDGSRNMFGTPGDDHFRPEIQNPIMHSSAGCDHYDGNNQNWATVSYANAIPTDSLNYMVIDPQNEATNNNRGEHAGCDTYDNIQAYNGSRNMRTAFISSPANEQFSSYSDNDFASYDGNYADYEISYQNNGETVKIRDTRTGAQTDGFDTLRGVETIGFNDGVLKNGEFSPHKTSVKIDMDKLPDDALGVAVYYGPNLDEVFATANGMKEVIDDRMNGVTTPALGEAGSSLKQGTMVHVFSRAQLEQNNHYSLPVNGTLDDPVGVATFAIMPVSGNQENKPYHERSVPQQDRYRTEVPLLTSVTPSLYGDADYIHKLQEAGCYMKQVYPLQLENMKNLADLNTADSMAVTLGLSTSACVKHEDANEDYIQNNTPSGP